ncbi:MAG: ABC transporter permease [Anaerolineae bacterium]|nr:ABC transporter permease [Anaerolineae bacterium]
MLDDISTVIWKERKGLLRTQGSVWRTIVSVLIPMIMISIVLPIQMGADALHDAWPLVGAFIVPLILVGITVPQSFAGERENHTLETLLASRLPDRAIFLGKVGIAVAYGWLAALVTLAIMPVVVNLVHWEGTILFYEPEILIAGVVVSLLMSALIASLGVLISLRSATAQGAQQALISVLLVPIMFVQIVPMILISVIPNGGDVLEQWLSIDFTLFALILAGVLLALVVACFLLAAVRF